MRQGAIRGPGPGLLFGAALGLALSAAAPAAGADAGTAGEIGTLDTQAALHLSPGDVFAVQRSLGRMGFLAGEANGVLDDRTQIALAAWQRSQGLAPTGRLAPRQWANLRASNSQGEATWRDEIGTVDAEAGLSLHPSDVATLQTTLLRLRLFRAAPTGALDEETRRALAAWQRGAGFAATGHIGPKQWAALREAAPLAPALDDIQGELGTVYGEAALDLDAGEIRTVQDRLCALKYFRGPIGGEMDEATRSALIRWQKEELVTATGYLGPLQFDALLASTPRSPDGVSLAPCGDPEATDPPKPAPLQAKTPSAPKYAAVHALHRRVRYAPRNPFAVLFQGLGMGFGQAFALRAW